MMQGDLLLAQGSGRQSGKIVRRHQERLAIVYIRQSTVQQVERHQESTRLQYGLVDRALQYGWARETIVVIDDDLGRSGATVEGAAGLPAPGRGSRSRSCRAGAWHRDVAAGAVVPGLAPVAGDLRAVRHADRRCGWHL
jgi:hypothetical protein